MIHFDTGTTFRGLLGMVILYECTVCGALVKEEGISKHARFHQTA